MTDEELADKYAEEYFEKKTELVDVRKLALYKDAFLAGLKASRPQWHKLDWEKDFLEADKLIRVRLRNGMEHICETCYYEPTEDEIGYGKLVISFYELNGEWIDDNDIIAWCEIEPFEE